MLRDYSNKMCMFMNELTNKEVAEQLSAKQ